MLVQDFLHLSAEKFPAKTALVCEGKKWTYAEIEEMSNRLAQALIAQGLQRWDRVAVFLANSLESVLAIFAILKAGGIFLVLHPTTKQERLVYILNNCSARFCITADENLELIRTVQSQVPSLLATILVTEKPLINMAPVFLSFNECLAAYPAHRPVNRNIDQDLACLIYTSGSTGEPKGVMSGHCNMVFAAKSIITYLKNTVDDIVLNMFPFSFDYGLYQLLMVFCFGGTLILRNSITYLATVFNEIEAERVTGLPGVPTFFALMLQMDLSHYDLSSLRYITNTADALPVHFVEKIRRACPQVNIYLMYGLTECKRALYLPPELADKKPAAVGIPIPGTEVWLVNESGEPVKQGETGELVIRGSHVMRGYWQDPLATERVYKSGLFPGERILYSGDLFRQDEEGYYYFVARKNTIIKSRGEKVSPKEIENVLYSLEGVAEAAVIGVSDDLLGQAIKAFIVVKEHSRLDVKKVLKHCREHLESFMVPQIVEFCARLPKNASGKIDRKSLG
jgi:amino acid adenylation domain-containing protein